ncbi:hypothetical protein HUN08_14215 [Gordonia sp. X0973]|uniref:hypothetical protein n=1 Tax=Gordonia sp. X0973 TaxID=2742602 RepID=UPI0013EA4F9F|nr:hypothetical protein [Gordonia sp. X0973]QKT08222.1 hypothetical protein HUN08_14215 [Gordonia sp. X0973]
MPTALPRIQVTQTPQVAEALEVAARTWPDVPRSELVTRLMTAGAETLETERADRRARRRRQLDRLRGTVDYPPAYLDDLRAGWPE